MAFPQVQQVGADGTVIGASGGISITGSVSTPVGAGLNALVPVSNASIAATTAYVSVKVGPGRYFGLTAATSDGGGTIVVTDGSGGMVIGGLTSGGTLNAAPQWVGPSTGVPFFTACVVVSTTSSSVATVHFS